MRFFAVDLNDIEKNGKYYIGILRYRSGGHKKLIAFTLF